MDDNTFLQMAVEQAEESVRNGGFPAGAVVVKDGQVIARGISIGNLLHDPTAHAESVSVRAACAKLLTTNLLGATLYASLEPCLMCFHAANWAQVGRIVYGCRKSVEFVKKGYYEGQNSIDDLNAGNSRKLALCFLPTYEKDMLALVKQWEDSLS